MRDQNERDSENSGVQNTGSGTINIQGSAIGNRAKVYNRTVPRPGAGRPSSAMDYRCDVGVITILSEETRAVVDVLSAAGRCRKNAESSDGLRFHEAEVDVEGKHIRVVATQSLSPGQQPAVMAFQHLHRHYRPRVTVIAGIGGAIHPSVKRGDVVMVHEVIYYDLRKVTHGKVIRRGQTRPIPAATRRAVNDFFSEYGEPYQAMIEDRHGVARPCTVRPGPIGSGDAVVADDQSDIRKYLADFNDKTLAVEMESGGLAEAFYETVNSDSTGGGWLAIRGISDAADPRKDDSYHEIASWHAAVVLGQLLPYLKPGEVSLGGPGGRP
jgi:nucleoside phosphorylase